MTWLVVDCRSGVVGLLLRGGLALLGASGGVLVR